MRDTPWAAAVLGHCYDADPEERQRRVDEVARSTSPYAMAGVYNAQHLMQARPSSLT